MDKIRTFRDLIAWQKGMDLAATIYQATAQMPEDERFGLVQQMWRAAVSVPSNIADGYARQSTTEYLRFLRMARGSLAELSTQWELALRLMLLEPDQRIEALLAECDRVLQGLIRSLGQRAPKKRPQ